MSTIILIAVLVIVVCFVTMYNGFISLKNSIKEAFATMDVYLKKRWDLIPNLVETVKSYAAHEKNTLENIVNLRNSAYDKMPIDKKIQANKQLSSELSKLMLVVENYPDLKANQNFLDLNTQLVKMEEDIANSRKYYNAVVKEYNIKIESFPSNLIANICNFRQHEMFEIDDVQRENIQVKF